MLILLIVTVEVDAAIEDELNRWYDTVHLMCLRSSVAPASRAGGCRQGGGGTCGGGAAAEGIGVDYSHEMSATHR